MYLASLLDGRGASSTCRQEEGSEDVLERVEEPAAQHRGAGPRTADQTAANHPWSTGCHRRTCQRRGAGHDGEKRAV